METNKDIKLKVDDIVESYKKNYPDDYRNTCLFVKQYRENIINKWAEIPGSNIEMREINRLPELLANLIRIGLEDDEYQEFRTDKFQKWFTNRYHEFRVVEGTV